MKIEYSHDLDHEEARARLEALGDYLSNRHGINVEWNGDSAKFSGRYMVVRIEGVLSFADGKVNFDGRDPGMLWRKKATNYIKKKLNRYLNPAEPLADLPRQ